MSPFKSAAWTICLMALIHCLPASATLAPVRINNTWWYQPAALTGASWNEFDEACPPPSRICTANVNGNNIQGWKWATQRELGFLFAALSPHPGGAATYREVDSDWAPLIFELFMPILPAPTLNAVTGWVSTPVPAPSQNAYLGSVLDFDNTLTSSDDSISNEGDRPRSAFGPAWGAWLLRPVDVPAPATLALFGVGLAALGINRRRRRKPIYWRFSK